MDHPKLFSRSQVQRGFAILLIAVVLAETSSCGLSSTPPKIFVPTPDCGSPKLTFGTTSFEIQPVKPAADGSLKVPGDKSQVAYWVDGTTTNYVFVIPPTDANLATEKTLFASIATETASVTWTDCNSTSYTLSAPVQGALSADAMPAQSVPGLTVFFEEDSAGTAFILTGQLAGQEITTIETPTPGVSQVQAEVSLLGATPSADGKTITVSVSIANTGESSLTLSSSDVSLTPHEGAVPGPSASDPSLPREIRPGKTQTMKFTFPRPSAPSATLRIFSVEYEVTGY